MLAIGKRSSFLPCELLHNTACMSHGMAIVSPGASDTRANKARSNHLSWLASEDINHNHYNAPLVTQVNLFQCARGQCKDMNTSHWGSLEAILEAAFHNFFKNSWGHFILKGVCWFQFWKSCIHTSFCRWYSSWPPPLKLIIIGPEEQYRKDIQIESADVSWLFLVLHFFIVRELMAI